MTGSISKLPQASLDRALVYGWFARLFIREPDAETLKAYSSPTWKPLLDDFETKPSLAPTVEELRRCLDKEPKQVVLDLAVVFGRLFYGVDGPESVPPYESAHLSDKGLLFQKPFEELNEITKQLDLSVSQTFKEPADHLSVELAIMSELAERAEHARQVSEWKEFEEFLKKQASFLDQHLLAWLPKFQSGCQEREPESLYAKAANSLLLFVREDRKWLSNCHEKMKKTNKIK